MKRDFWLMIRRATITIVMWITYPNAIITMFRPSNTVHAYSSVITVRIRPRMVWKSTSTTVSPSLISKTASFSSSTSSSSGATTSNTNGSTDDRSQNFLLNLSTVQLEELETLVTSWGFPKYRASQVYHWIRQHGITDVNDMKNIPKDLKQKLSACTQPTSLRLVLEQISQKDGTIKRAYQCQDGQIIESVLMAYEDGRYTACISSQAGCAQGCVFCATGQMGLARQLSDAEIFEQVARFAAELQKQQDEEQKQKRKNVPETVSLSTLSESQTTSTTRTKRLSNVVFMGMGEPLANYRNVKSTIHRITKELGIGGRRVTVSTVGIVEGIRKLTKDPDMPQVKLAVSLHSADDEERSALLPANRKNGGLSELMTVLREYIETTNRRITLEWALIAGTNDGIDTARKLGGLVQKYNLRSDMVHVNVIPLNPTQKYAGKPSRRNAVEAFCACLIREYGISCTPRVRRGIDIDAGCGQLKSKIQKNRAAESSSQQITPSSETHGDNGSAVILNGNQDQE